jgi:flavin-binding protein dodecin
MTILKSEQILADSKLSWQHAVETAVGRFARTVRNVRSAYVNEMTTVIEHGRIAAWRVNLQITFEVDEPGEAAAGVAAGASTSEKGKKGKKGKKNK